MEEQIPAQPSSQPKSFSVMQTLGVVALAMLITAVGTVFAIKIFLFPPPFDPVTLSPKEEQQLCLGSGSTVLLCGGPNRSMVIHY